MTPTRTTWLLYGARSERIPVRVTRQASVKSLLLSPERVYGLRSMRTLCKALLPLSALALPLVPVASSTVSASIHNPCTARFLGPTFSPNGGYAYCAGGGSVAGDHLRVMLKCQTDTAWRYGPASYSDNLSSVLYCPTGRLATQVSIAIYQ